MVSAFDSPNLVASSALIEGYFKDLKNQKPMTKLNKFILRHSNDNKARCILAKAALNYAHKVENCITKERGPKIAENEKPDFTGTLKCMI